MLLGKGEEEFYRGAARSSRQEGVTATPFDRGGHGGRRQEKKAILFWGYMMYSKAEPPLSMARENGRKRGGLVA